MAGPNVGGNHQSWSSRLAFIFATIGFSVGLGNIWRFPYLAGESGGGAFVLIYLLCVVLIGVPIVMAEMAIGRRGGMTPVATLANLASSPSSKPFWKLSGGFIMLTAFLIETFYCVIGGWTLHYVYLAASGALINIDVVQSQALFDALLADPVTLIAWQAVFLAINAIVLSRGLQKGLEKAVTILMPTLFILLVALAVYGVIAADAAGAIRFLFSPDFSVVSGKTLIDAMGQAFFSVGVGMAAMITYGAYLPKHVNIPSTSLIVAFADTGVALIAGLAIFPFVFALGLSPSEGPGLVFVALPAALSGYGGGFASLAFFALLGVAALTSSFALLEVFVSRAEERGTTRGRSAPGFAVLVFIIGLGTVFSLNIAQDVHPLGAISGFETATFFDIIDWFTSSIGLPIGGLLAALFAGWVLPSAIMSEELSVAPDTLWYRAWRVLMRYGVPLVILTLIVSGARE